MDIGKSIGFVFEDEKWIEKVLIGGLVSLIPLVGSFLIIGYIVKLVRNVRNGDPKPLPEWTEWGELLVDGFKLFVVYFLWSLPLIVILLFAIIPSAMMSNSDGDASTFVGLFATCFGCISFLYWIVLTLVSPAILIRFAETGEIGDGLNFNAILTFSKGHIGEIILVVIVGIVISSLASIVGSLLCIIGVIFTGFWSNAVIAFMIAHIGKDDAPVTNVFEPAPPLD